MRSLRLTPIVNNGIQSSIESKDVPVWLIYILKKKPGQIAQVLKMHNKIYNYRSVQSLYARINNCCASTYVHLNTGWIIAPNRQDIGYINTEFSFLILPSTCTTYRGLYLCLFLCIVDQIRDGSEHVRNFRFAITHFS